MNAEQHADGDVTTSTSVCVVPNDLLEQVETMLLRAAGIVYTAGEVEVSSDLDVLALKIRLTLDSDSGAGG